MSVNPILRAAALGLTCLALTACTNSPDKHVTATTITKSLFKGRAKPKPVDPNQLAASIQTVLASTNAPVIALAIPNRKAATVMSQLDVNHGYATFGTSDRRSVTLRGGMVTGTRGLGEDIMSSDISGVQALIAGRRNGTAQRVTRYLNGEDVTVAQVTTCTVSVGTTDRYQLAEVNSAATSVSETCRAEGGEFTNTYRVAPTGRVLQSRFWHSPMNEYITIQALR
ncbi:YjbF family lipoprotein [Rhodobacteraceae bacterium KMM 6894]|nr:YjbF family lipoprotein [Rhodobacteraceae bacterium KMM 6894]